MSESQTAAPTTPDAPAPGMTRIVLKYPVTIDGLKCEHLDLRRPLVEDLLHAAKIGGSDAEKEVAQFAVLSGVTPKLITKLDVVDYLAVQKQVQAFLS